MMENVVAGGLFLLVASVMLWMWLATKKKSDEDKEDKQ